MKTDIIILTHNQDKSLLNFYEKLLNELKEIKYNLIFVDNCSNDKTYEILKEIQLKDEAHIKVISLAKKCNDNSAIAAALNYSKSQTVCIYDFTYPLSYIKKLIKYIENDNEYDSICLTKNLEFKNKIQKLWISLINKLLNINVVNDKTNYRIMNKKMKTAIINFSKTNRIYDDTFDKLGFKILYEKIKNNKSEQVKIDIPNNLKTPLKCSILGLSLILISLIYTIVIIASSKLSLITFSIFMLLLLSGINLTYSGILSTNIIRNIDKSEANYIIKDKYGFDEDVL